MAARPAPRHLASLAAGLLIAAGCSMPAQPSKGPGTSAPAASNGGPPSSGTPPAPASGAISTSHPDLARLAIRLEPFARVEGGPLAIAAPEDGSGRLFVVAQDGRIWIVQADGTVLPDPMVDLSGEIRSGGEQGLLGLAIHPGFPSDPRVFVNYTNRDGDSIVASLALDPADPNRLEPASERRILFVDQPFANHNGGALLFGPDGFLYAFLGDGGSGGDPQNNGQNRNSLLGKVLRLDIDVPVGAGGPTDPPYRIPAGNPFAGSNGRDEIWHLGLRNPWRASFDRQTGDLWIGDVGQSAFEEVDVARAGEGGLNFGWNRMEGSHCFPPGSSCRGEGLTSPVADYGRDLGCTIIGGYVYRGAAFPSLAGTYLFTDYCSGNIFAIDAATTELVAPTIVGSAPNGTSAFGQDSSGELYLTNLDGTISRLVAGTR